MKLRRLVEVKKAGGNWGKEKEFVCCFSRIQLVFRIRSTQYSAYTPLERSVHARHIAPHQYLPLGAPHTLRNKTIISASLS